jgi:hypothetical protein
MNPRKKEIFPKIYIKNYEEEEISNRIIRNPEEEKIPNKNNTNKGIPKKRNEVFYYASPDRLKRYSVNKINGTKYNISTPSKLFGKYVKK